MRVQMIEARWATYIADDLRRAGHALDGLLKEVGLSRADIASPEGRISYAAYMGLIERAALLLAEPAYGLKLGASHDVRDNGLLGFIAAQFADTPGRAGQRRALHRRHQRGNRCSSRNGWTSQRPALPRRRSRSSPVAAKFRTGVGAVREGRAGADAGEGDPGARGVHSRAAQRAHRLRRHSRLPRPVPGRMGCGHLLGGDPAAAGDWRRQPACCARWRPPAARSSAAQPRKEDLIHSVREYIVQGWQRERPRSTTWPAIST